MVTEPSERSCCASSADGRIARRFDCRASRWVDAPALPPMVDVSAHLLRALADVEQLRPSILELGCGTGGLSIALLERGASRLSGVDLSETSVRVARRRAEAAALADVASFSVGDASVATLEAHDWVVLDRVLCCFADADRLVAAAVGAAEQRIALSIPESRGWRGLLNRPLWAMENLWDVVRGGCRGFVHDVGAVEARLAADGFRPVAGRQDHAGLWFVGVYERQPRISG